MAAASWRRRARSREPAIAGRADRRLAAATGARTPRAVGVSSVPWPRSASTPRAGRTRSRAGCPRHSPDTRARRHRRPAARLVDHAPAGRLGDQIRVAAPPPRCAGGIRCLRPKKCHELRRGLRQRTAAEATEADVDVLLLSKAPAVATQVAAEVQLRHSRRSRPGRRVSGFDREFRLLATTSGAGAPPPDSAIAPPDRNVRRLPPACRP